MIMVIESTKIDDLLHINTIIIGLIVFIIFYLALYYKKVYSYPRGPFPLPVLGNVLHFRGYGKTPIIFQMTQWSKKYGPIYTLWVGSKPIIVLNNNQVYSEATIHMRNINPQKPDSILHKIFRNGFQNMFSTNGEVWEALRKIGVLALRKFQTNGKLSQIVSEVIDESVDIFVKMDEPINDTIFNDFIIYNVMSMTSFGNKFVSIDNKVYKESKNINDELYILAGNGLIQDYIPWLRYFYYPREVRLKRLIQMTYNATINTFKSHIKDYTSGIIRDFSDGVIEGRDEAIREKESRNKYYNENNLFMVVSDLFQAGGDSLQKYLRWIVLFVANDPQLRQKIYEEINTNIGERIATEEDKDCLPFTCAFLKEILRFRSPVPMSEQCYDVGTVLAGYHIPKNTIILSNLYAQNNDPKYWSKPDVFDPNRFLDTNGQLITNRLASYVPFGLGTRMCPAEKYTQNALFLITVRLIQRMRIELNTGDYSADLIPENVINGSFPKDYKIIFHKRQ